MLTENEIEAKLGEVGGDGIYLHGHKVKLGYAWEVVLKAPDVLNWESYQRNKTDPAAVYAFVLSMMYWCGSDVLSLPPDAKLAFATVRSRFVAAPEAITNDPVFLRFIGLEASSIEK